jgi:16S rRNA (guanine(966)-N(2))-methyltransferase RsmD
VKPLRAGAPPREVRIVGGRYKRSRLPVPDRPGLRPTPERVRETLFNWLGQDLRGWRVLDAFAGSGALGFEAASRGAAEVVLVERDAALAQALRRSAQRLGAAQVRVVSADALAWLARAAPASFDLVLVDPPFDAGLHAAALAVAAPAVAAGGWLYVEAGRALEPPLGWVLHRHGRAGAVHFHLLCRPASTQGYTGTPTAPGSAP